MRNLQRSLEQEIREPFVFLLLDSNISCMLMINSCLWKKPHSFPVLKLKNLCFSIGCHSYKDVFLCSRIFIIWVLTFFLIFFFLILTTRPFLSSVYQRIPDPLLCSVLLLCRSSTLIFIYYSSFKALQKFHFLLKNRLILLVVMVSFFSLSIAVFCLYSAIYTLLFTIPFTVFFL